MDEGAAHTVGISETRLDGDDFDGLDARLDPLARRLEPKSLHRLGRAQSRRRPEGAAELARAHARFLRQGLDRPVKIQSAPDIVEEIGETVVRRGKLEQRRKLRLPARSSIVDDHRSRRLPGDLLTEILGDQSQGQINPGTDSRRGPDPSLPNVDSIGLRADLRKPAGEVRGALPMSRG